MASVANLLTIRLDGWCIPISEIPEHIPKV